MPPTLNSNAFHTARRIVVRATNWVGDVLMTTPTLARLRALKPEAEITVLARSSVAPLLRNNPAVDDIWTIADQSTGGFFAAMRRLRAGRFDWGLALPNSFGSALLLRTGGVKAIRGYARDGRAALLAEPLALRPEDLSIHEVTYYLRLLDGLGESHDNAEAEQQPGNPPLFYAVAPEDRKELDARLDSLGLSPATPFLAISPGAAYGTAKRWLPERYAQAAAELARERGWSVALTGSRVEKELCETIRGEIHAILGKEPVAWNLAEVLSLRQWGALLERAKLLLTNDSGAMHLGAALGTPLVAIFGPTDWITTFPWSRRARLVRVETECAPCLLRHCPIDHRCMKRVGVEEVVSAAHELLAQPQ